MSNTYEITPPDEPLNLTAEDLAALQRAATRLPSIATPGNDLGSLRQAILQIKEVIETREGARGPMVDKAVTWRELFRNGLTSFTVGGENYVASPGGSTANNPPLPDLSIPPSPTGVTATGALASIILVFDAPNYGNHSYAEIWRSATNDIGTAVLTGTTRSQLYVDAVGGAATFYYWVRFVSAADVKGPYNATLGTAGATGTDPALLLDMLTGEITASQLHATLGSRIDLIDGPSSMVGSVAQRINEEATTRANAILSEAALRANGDANLQTQINTLVAGTSGDLAEVLAAVQAEQTARTNADAAEATSRETLATQVRGSYTGTDLTQLTSGLLYSERTARTTADASLSSSISSLQATVTNNYNTLNSAITNESTARANAISAEASSRDTLAAQLRGTYTGTTLSSVTSGLIYSERIARADGDNALSSRIDTLTATVNSNTAAITTEQTARANGDSANATAISTLQTTVNGHTTSIQTQQTSINGLSAQVFTKIDNNGYVTGYGLDSSIGATGTPTSTFAVRADKFYIANPTGPSILPAMPFIVQTTATTVNGVSVPAGVYMSDAFIQNGTITNAKIGNAAIDDAKIANLSADKITAGDIAAARMSANIVTAVSGKFDTLSAVTASTGTLRVETGGFIRSTSATAYGTGVGFWMGDDAGIYKFRVGSPTGNQLSWDGSTLTIKGALNGATGSFSGDISAASGNFRGAITGGAITGWAWPAAGSRGFYLGPNGLLLGDYNGGKYLYADMYGGLQTNLTLMGCDGTFSGTLTASAVNAVDTINLAGNAVTIPTSAYLAQVDNPYGNYYDMPITFTSSGGPVLITVSARMTNTGAVGTWTAEAVIWRNSIAAGNRVCGTYQSLNASSIAISATIKHTPGSGTVTYLVRFSGGNHMYDLSVWALEVKR